ncbi:MAG: damage-control phosphatase ARMT1 family protein [Thermodesulfobacteriota bacterium]
MWTYLDCFPCFLSQALRAARMATDDEKMVKQVLDEVGMMLKDIPLTSTPPESGRRIYQKVSAITGNKDPYKEIKAENTRKALSLYPALKDRVQASEDSLLTAVRIAIAGNVIDFGPGKAFDLKQDIEEILTRDFGINDYPSFKACLNAAREILFIGDNAGESVFDRILIEEMKKPVRYAVRGMPIINDVTFADAVQAGIDEVAAIISSGTDAPGAILATCSPEFRNLYEGSSFIVSKGQGNYEALSHTGGPLFFLLKAKCRVIAEDLGVKEGDIVLKQVKGSTR